MGYIVKEIIETDREGNAKKSGMRFKTYGQAVSHIRQRIKDIIRKDTLKFLRVSGRKPTAKLVDDSCNEDFEFWMNENEADSGQFCYVASYLGWSCFWFLEVESPN